MASIIRKWLRRCLFICVCSFFLMSHNASALNNQLLGDNWYLYRQTSGNPFCAQNSTSADARRQSDYSPWNINNGEYSYWSCVDSDSKYSSLNAAGGDIIVVELNTDYELSPYWYNTSARYLFTSYSRNIQTIYYATNGFNKSVEFGWTYNSEINGANNTLFRIQSINIYKPKGQADYNQALNDIKNNLNNINNGINNVNNSINNINDDVKNSTQDAADEAADSGDQSAADAENATAGLISVIGGFVNAITSASPTNCKINGKINNSFNMGELDLCSMPVPPFVQIISSLILIAICIPFAIVMFNRFIGLFRSFQG